MPRLLITGFEAFAGRAVNASWEVAQALAAMPPADLQVRALQLPVRWGRPQALLRQAIKLWQPQAILSLGEGHPGHFAVETLARKQRQERADNAGRYPLLEPVLANGPTCIHSSTDTATLVAALAAQQLPVVESCDAGAYLCEETLYMLEHLRKSTHSLQQVLFVHLPPWQSEIHYRGQNCRCELTLLSDFLQRLLRHFPNRELSR